MKKIWVVISGIDYEDCQNIEGCFESFQSAKIKVDELKNKIIGEWGNEYCILPNTKEKVIFPYSWSNKQNYLKIEEQNLLS